MSLRLRSTLTTLFLVASIGHEARAQATDPAAPPPESHVSARDLGLPRFDANAHYVPTPGDRFLGVADGVVYRPLNEKDSDAISRHLSQFRVDLVDAAFHPLKIYQRDASGTETKQDALSYQFYVFRLLFAFQINERLAVGTDLSFGGSQSAADANNPDTKATTVFGDPRFFARFNVIGNAVSPFALGFQGDFWVPIGTANKLTADASARFLPRVMASGVVDHFFYALNAGFLFRQHEDFGDYVRGNSAEIGNAFTYGAGAGFFFHEGQRRTSKSDINAHQFGVELYGNTVLPAHGSDSPLFGRSSSPAELLFHYRGGAYSQDREGHSGLYVAAGPGLTRAPGVPTWRLLVGVDIAGHVLRPDPIPDTDGDGVPDPSDECPNQAGTAAFKGCPAPPDDDHDGVPNKDDKCPNEPGPASSHGCPAPPPPPKDKDKDGVPDAQDACPDQAGPSSSDPLTSGCPDSDKDGIVDKLDACPTVAGPASKDPAKNGCPGRAALQGKQIVISEQVLFQPGTDRIDAASTPLLDEVAEILKDHPEIELLSVEGHSDNKGNKARNTALSLQRAKAVVKALAARKIEEKRLVAAGLGDSKPIASNDTEDGRAKNRRVEFHARRMANSTPTTPTTPTTPATPATPGSVPPPTPATAPTTTPPPGKPPASKKP